MTSSRQAFFARFARKARHAIRTLTLSSNCPLVLLTGGMGSPTTFEDALSHGHTDLIGIGRGSVLAPNLPLLLEKAYSHRETGEGNDDTSDTALFQQPTLSYSDAPLIRAAASILRFLGILPLPNIIGAGTETAWYVVMLSRISRGRRIDYQMGGMHAVLFMWLPEPRAFPVVIFCCMACYGLIYLWSHVRE
jgi:hypothetical protein